MTLVGWPECHWTKENECALGLELPAQTQHKQPESFEVFPGEPGLLTATGRKCWASNVELHPMTV